MNMFEMQTIMTNEPVAISLAVISVLLAAWVLTEHLRSRKLRQQVEELNGFIHLIRNDIRGLFAGAVGEDSRIHKLETRTRRILERQELLENNNTSERPYEQAIRMVQKGSSREDIISICNLSKGEADLIMMIHGKQHEQQAGKPMH